ncbi:hypothetical protein [Gandjariella thermophila]|uniref:Uncharacterized protein n=1 Tax=Gandjariella thermophila TaxID=1931992 RepID=A0A4D4J5A9_9PSEU|nr:hypothetical protein [Gandjariella thermophila]GDY29918.1 hypothetical protein GTS_15510 [Gandjariella thermophila]
MTASITGLTAKALAAPGVLPLLAAPGQPGDPGGQGEDFGKSSPVGLLVLILFFIAVGFLVRSMTKHLRKVPASFDEPTDRAGRSGEDAAPGERDEAGGDAADRAEDGSPGQAPEHGTAKRPHRT